MTTDTLAIWAESMDLAGMNIIMGRSESNDLPWPHNSEDLRHFRESTRDRILIMGRKTFESLPAVLKTPQATFERPLIILTKRPHRDLDIDVAGYWHVADGTEGPERLLELAMLSNYGKQAAIIGGASVIEFFEPVIDRLSVTSIRGRFDGDVRAPSNNFMNHFRAHSSLVNSTGVVTTYLRKEPRVQL